MDIARAGELWDRVDELAARAPLPGDLEAHGLHQRSPAARRTAAICSLVAPIALERARAVTTGPLLLMKGPELAERYPDSALRPFRDLDLLVADALHTQRELLAGGFHLTGDPRLYVDIHHLQPLASNELPLVLEIHQEPKWPVGLPAAPLDAILDEAVPSVVGVDGILAPRPAHHALLVAAHSWAHAPLARLSHLVDVAALLEEADRADVAATARAWGIERMWRTTQAVVDWLFHDGRRPAAAAIWARHLASARERSVLGLHLERCLSPFWALPARHALAASARAFGDEFRPVGDESPRTKVIRSAHAIWHARRRTSEHDASVEQWMPEQDPEVWRR
jgi:Uncharacterised nucleotidyltransferase